MPDFTSNIAFTVKFDLTTLGAPVLELTDTSTGLSGGVTGRFDITQPNGVTRYGNPSLPDITYGGTAMFRFPLSHAMALDWQLGSYSITYTLSKSGYTDTPLTHSFIFNFEGITLALQDQFDVFTPQLKYLDITDYSVDGFNAPAISRAWVGNSSPTGNITSTVSSIDLVYSTNYYSANYTVSLLSTVTYQSTTNSWFSFVFKTIVATATQLATAPPSLALMLNWLTVFRVYLEKQVDVDLPTLYGQAAGYYSEVKSIICAGGNNTDLIGKLYALTHRGASMVAKPTNLPIPAFDFSSCDYSSTVIIKLAAPTVTVGTPTTTGFPLNWGAITNADGYEIQTSIHSDYSSANDGETSATNYTPSGLTANTLYYWRVRSLDSTNTYTTSDWTTGSATTAASGVTGYWLQTDAPITLESQITAGTAIAFAHNADVTVPFNALSSAPKYLIFCEPVGESAKTYVFVNTGNQFPISSGNYYEGSAVIGTYRVYQPSYPSSFYPNSAIFKATP